jgi:hypothetical protein
MVSNKALRVCLFTVCSIVLLVTLIFLPSYRITDSDKIEAVIYIVAWISEEKPIPGFDQEYPDWDIIKKKQILVVCDFLPSSVTISLNPRVQRISVDEYQKKMREKGFEGIDYLVLKIQGENSFQLSVEASNRFGISAGHGYLFSFSKKIYGLKVNGKLSWII